MVLEHHVPNEMIKETAEDLYVIAQEMNKFSRELNDAYHRKNQLENFDIDISSAVDKRTKLFN